jgi:hypothetical protein
VIALKSILKYRALNRIIIILIISLPLPLVAPPHSVAQEAPLNVGEASAETKDQLAPKQPGPIPRARWSEDWSTIGNSPPFLEDTGQPPARGFWRPLKYIPLNESGESYISLGGEARFAYENYDDKDMGISDIGNQDAQQLRLGLHADLHLNKRWRIFTQLGYGTVLDDREGGEKIADETDLDIWELFVDYRIPVRDDERVVIRLGRQLIETGNLFINAGEGNNVRQVYDGLRVGWLDGDFVKFAAFATEYVDFDDDSFGMSGTDEYFWGLRTGVRINKSVLDLQFLYTG